MDIKKSVNYRNNDDVMRVLANVLIDRVLVMRQEGIKMGLNINLKKDILIMEQQKTIKES